MKLHYLNGPKSGEVVVLTPPVVTLGREIDNDLSLLVEGISRYHAKIDFNGNVWTISDLGSTNGSKVDGNVIGGPTQLKGGELIALGDQMFKFDAGCSVDPGMQTEKITVPSLPQEKITIEESVPSESADETKPESCIMPSSPKTTPKVETAAQPVLELTPAPEAQQAQESTPPPAVMFTPTAAETSPDAGASVFGAAPQQNAGILNQQPQANEIPVDKNAAAPATDQQSGAEVKFDFFKSGSSSGGDEKKSNRFLMNALFYVGVLFLAVVLIFFFLSSQKTNTVNTQPIAVQKALPPFLLVYEKQVTSKDNIFHYSMVVEDKKIAITLDDLKYQRHVSEPQELNSDQLESLKHAIRSSNFLELNPVEQGTAPADEDDTRKITICIDGQFNEVVVKNNFAPNSFIEAERVVEELSATELGVRSVTLTPEEMKEEAREAFDMAQDKFDNYEAHPMNLTLAIKRYQLTMDNLKSFTSKPEYWELARKNKLKAEKILDDKVNALFFNGNKSKKLSLYDEARAAMLKILEMLDATDPRYERARKGVIKLDIITRGQKQR